MESSTAPELQKLEIANPLQIETVIHKRYTFEASHRLEWHKGKCHRLHGHSYKLHVWAKGSLNENGIVMDFDDLSALVDDLVVKRYDHYHLNDYPEFEGNPTAERISQVILTTLNRADSRIFKVRVYETEKCYAESEC